MANEEAGEVIYLDPNSRFEIRLIPETGYAEAAEVLAPATGEGTTEAALARIRQFADDGKVAVYGGLLSGELVAAYLLKRDGMANEVALIAVSFEQRKRGIGRLLLKDALQRSGKRPLTAETDEAGLGFYKACGFKLVGRRKHPSGVFRYRIGWHAPGARFKGGTTGATEGRQEVGPAKSAGEES